MRELFLRNFLSSFCSEISVTMMFSFSPMCYCKLSCWFVFYWPFWLIVIYKGNVEAQMSYFLTGTEGMWQLEIGPSALRCTGVSCASQLLRALCQIKCLNKMERFNKLNVVETFKNAANPTSLNTGNIFFLQKCLFLSHVCYFIEINVSFRDLLVSQNLYCFPALQSWLLNYCY